ncbi:metal ABC transporter ATP-binding protein [Vibrio splendidus]|uniref:metal ABC transporter ATP-binding protein n=1 Tax=Vibrio splendidus TaxID=29497 RepID=UPI003D09DE7A
MINIKNLVTGYSYSPVSSPINIEIKQGSMTALIGINGCGKSTLLKTLAGLLKPQSGEVSYTGRSRPQIAYLPQQADLDRDFPLNVYDVVSMGCWPKRNLWKRIKHQDHQNIEQALKKVNLAHLANASISELSGGQFQRMLFARLFVQQALILMLDEPFSGIDAETSELLIRLIQQLNQEGHTIIVVLHDNESVANFFPESLLLTPSKNYFGPSKAVIKTWDQLNQQKKISL